MLPFQLKSTSIIFESLLIEILDKATRMNTSKASPVSQKCPEVHVIKLSKHIYACFPQYVISNGFPPLEKMQKIWHENQSYKTSNFVLQIFHLRSRDKNSSLMTSLNGQWQNVIPSPKHDHMRLLFFGLLSSSFWVRFWTQQLSGVVVFHIRGRLSMLINLTFWP